MPSSAGPRRLPPGLPPTGQHPPTWRGRSASLSSSEKLPQSSIQAGLYGPAGHRGPAAWTCETALTGHEHTPVPTMLRWGWRPGLALPRGALCPGRAPAGSTSLGPDARSWERHCTGLREEQSASESSAWPGGAEEGVSAPPCSRHREAAAVGVTDSAGGTATCAPPCPKETDCFHKRALGCASQAADGRAPQAPPPSRPVTPGLSCTSCPLGLRAFSGGCASPPSRQNPPGAAAGEGTVAAHHGFQDRPHGQQGPQGLFGA